MLSFYKLSFVCWFLLSSTIITKVNCNFSCTSSKNSNKSTQGEEGLVEFPANQQYDTRPNIFIDKDNLLGKTGHDKKKEFSYGNGPFGPAHWPKMWPKCGGKHQSPVNIDIPSLKNVQMSQLKWNNVYEDLPLKMCITNTHNTLQLDISFDGEQRPTLSGGPLTKRYTFKSLHFHWASSDHKGSEHTINKKTFPLEMHVVHYRSDLNATNAFAQDKGLCVVGYIFEINNDKCNEAITDILSVADQATLERDIPVELTNLFRLDTLVDKIDSDYVTYSGSLTTPPCHESVIWIISPYTLTIAKQQMQKFRQISMGNNGFGDNYRPLQPLNDRVITFVKSHTGH